MTFDNVSPRRMSGGYFYQTDLEGYLQEQWPNIPLRDFRIRVRRAIMKLFIKKVVLRYSQRNNNDTLSFVAPRELSESDWR